MMLENTQYLMLQKTRSNWCCLFNLRGKDEKLSRHDANKTKEVLWEKLDQDQWALSEMVSGCGVVLFVKVKRLYLYVPR